MLGSRLGGRLRNVPFPPVPVARTQQLRLPSHPPTSPTPSEEEAFWSEPCSYSSRYWNLETGLPNDPANHPKTPSDSYSEVEPKPDVSDEPHAPLSPTIFRQSANVGPGGGLKIEQQESPYLPQVQVDSNVMNGTSRLDRLPGAYGSQQRFTNAQGPAGPAATAIRSYGADRFMGAPGDFIGQGDTVPMMLQPMHPQYGPMDSYEQGWQRIESGRVAPDVLPMPMNTAMYGDPEDYVCNNPMTAPFDIQGDPGMPVESVYPDPELYGQNAPQYDQTTVPSESQPAEHNQKNISKKRRKRKALVIQTEDHGIDFAQPGVAPSENISEEYQANKRIRQETPPLEQRLDPRLLGLSHEESEVMTSQGRSNTRFGGRFGISTTPIPPPIVPGSGSFSPSTQTGSGQNKRAALSLGGPQVKKPRASRARKPRTNTQGQRQNANQQQVGQSSFHIQPSPLGGLQHLDLNTQFYQKDMPGFQNRGLQPSHDLGQNHGYQMAPAGSQQQEEHPAAPFANPGNPSVDPHEALSPTPCPRLEQAVYVGKPKPAWVILVWNREMRHRAEQAEAAANNNNVIRGLAKYSTLESSGNPAVYATLVPSRDGNDNIEIQFHAAEGGGDVETVRAGVEIKFADVNPNTMFKGMTESLVRHWCQDLLTKPQAAGASMRMWMRG